MSSYKEFLQQLTPEQQARDAANNAEQANQLLAYVNWMYWAKTGVASTRTDGSLATQRARGAVAGHGTVGS
jgi:hypothetical protein